MSLIGISFQVRHWGFIVLLIPGIWGMFYAFVADVFIDESETPMTEEHIDKVGIKATPLTRSIVFILALLMTGFALWKMFDL